MSYSIVLIPGSQGDIIAHEPDPYVKLDLSCKAKPHDRSSVC